MRLFLALELPSAVADGIHAAVQPLRGDSAPLSWVPAHKLHLTLKFLGEGDESRVEALGESLRRLAAGFRAMELSLGELGAFPNFRRPRVVWMGVGAEPSLELLYHDVELAAADAGYALEGRPFRPHVTLARVRAPLPGETARRLARSARAISYSASALVDRLTLFDSASSSAGAPYRRLATATLGGR